MSDEPVNQSQNGSGDHLTAAQLDAYHQQVLPASDTARIQTHLSHCHACADWLLEIAASESDPSNETRMQPDWSDLQQRLPKSEHDPAEDQETARIKMVQAQRQSELTRLTSELQRTRSAAAVLVFALVLALVWRQLDRSPLDSSPAASLDQPVTNMVVATPAPDSQPVRSSGIIVVSRETVGLNLLLTLPATVSDQQIFRLTLTDPSDRQVWQSHSVFASNGLVSLIMPRHTLKESGTYRVELANQDGLQVIDQYRLQIQLME